MSPWPVLEVDPVAFELLRARELGVLREQFARLVHERLSPHHVAPESGPGARSSPHSSGVGTGSAAPAADDGQAAVMPTRSATGMVQPPREALNRWLFSGDAPSLAAELLDDLPCKLRNWYPTEKQKQRQNVHQWRGAMRMWMQVHRQGPFGYGGEQADVDFVQAEDVDNDVSANSVRLIGRRLIRPVAGPVAHAIAEELTAARSRLVRADGSILLLGQSGSPVRVVPVATVESRYAISASVDFHGRIYHMAATLKGSPDACAEDRPPPPESPTSSSASSPRSESAGSTSSSVPGVAAPTDFPASGDGADSALISELSTEAEPPQDAKRRRISGGVQDQYADHTALLAEGSNAVPEVVTHVSAPHLARVAGWLEKVWPEERTVSISEWAYNKLAGLFIARRLPFAEEVFCCCVRYEALCGEGDKDGAGLQAACPQELFDCLPHATLEGFASPFNVGRGGKRYHSYCSFFPEDIVFGSVGSEFLQLPDVHLPAFVECNPPFDVVVMQRLLQKIHSCLDAGRDVVFLLIFPEWPGNSFRRESPIDTIMQSRYLAATILKRPHQHRYVRGRSWSWRRLPADRGPPSSPGVSKSRAAVLCLPARGADADRHPKADVYEALLAQVGKAW